MNDLIKKSIIGAITKAYPGVLFVSVNMSAKEMQLHYQHKVITDSTGEIDLSQGEMLKKLLGLETLEKVHIFVEKAVITFYGDGKSVNL